MSSPVSPCMVFRYVPIVNTDTFYTIPTPIRLSWCVGPQCSFIVSKGFRYLIEFTPDQASSRKYVNRVVRLMHTHTSFT